MEFNTLLFVKEDGIAIITLNRPKTYNAINEELIAELDQAMDAIIADAEIRAVIITGDQVLHGADIQAMSTMGTMQAERFVENCKTTFDKILPPGSTRDRGHRRTCSWAEDANLPWSATYGLRPQAASWGSPR